MLKNLFALRNRQINAKLMGKVSYAFDVLGRAVCAETEKYTVPIPTTRDKPPRKIVTPVVQITTAITTPAQTTPTAEEESLISEMNISSTQSNITHSVHTPVANTDLQLFDGLKALFKGLPNPMSNCWLNSCMVAVRHALGGSLLCEDICNRDIAPSDTYLADFKPSIQSLGLGSTSVIIPSAEHQSCIEKSIYSEELGHQDDPLRFFLHSAAVINENSVQVLGSMPLYEVKVKSMYTCTTCGNFSTTLDDPTNVINMPLFRQSPCQMNEMILNYFNDEVFERDCEVCGSPEHAVAKRLLNCPKILPLLVKRYDRINTNPDGTNPSMIKHSNVVIPSKELDVSAVMDSVLLPTSNAKYRLEVCDYPQR